MPVFKATDFQIVRWRGEGRFLEVKDGECPGLKFTVSNLLKLFHIAGTEANSLFFRTLFQ